MRKLLLASALAVSSVLYSPSQSLADLLISPLQVTMEGRARSAKIVLLNTGDSKNTYRLEWVQVEQAEYVGGYQEDLVKTGDDIHLQDFAVFTPRQITLMPNEKQVVRIGVRRPADLPDGEYKSHLKFGIISSEQLVKPEEKELGENEIAVSARIMSSYSIPVVYRKGDYDIKVRIGEPEMSISDSDGDVMLSVPVIHEGIHGAIGSTHVYYTPNGGQEVLLSSVGNTNIFPEATQRNVKIDTGRKGFAPGSLRIVFKKAEGELKDHVVLAEKIVPISN